MKSTVRQKKPPWLFVLLGHKVCGHFPSAAFPSFIMSPLRLSLSLSPFILYCALHLGAFSATERNLSVPDLVFLFQTRFRQSSGVAEHVLTTSAQGISHLLFSLITAREREVESKRERGNHYSVWVLDCQIFDTK